MANPFTTITPEGTWNKLFNVSQLAMQLMNMKQQYDLGTQGLDIQRGNQDIARERTNIDREQLGVMKEASRIKTEGPDVPVYKRTFKPITVLQKTSSFLNAFKKMPDVQSGIKKAIMPIFNEMKEFAAMGGETDNLSAAQHFKKIWPTAREDFEQNIEKVIMDLGSDNAWLQETKEGQALINLYNEVASDKDGSKMTQLLFSETVNSYVQEARMKEAEIAQKTGEPRLYETEKGWLPAGQAQGLMKPANESALPSDLKEFEYRTYGKEVPEKRGTPAYKDAQLSYLKEKREATTTPNKADPNILRKEFITQSKNFVEVRDSYNRIKSSAKDPSAAGDLAMIFNYMKMLDPGSVVRESEFATAAATGAYGERIKAAVARVVSGERLSDEMRKDFKLRADMLYKEQEGSHNKLKAEYDRLSKEFGVEPSNVLIDYITEQKKIEGGQFDVGEIYEDANGKKARYKGKDATGKDIWEPING